MYSQTKIAIPIFQAKKEDVIKVAEDCIEKGADVLEFRIDALDNPNFDDIKEIIEEINFPESVRDVVKLYARITKAYYESDVSEENIEKLGRQARILFDDELKNTQTEDEFLSALKEDISIYRNNNAKISSFNIQTANNTRYTKFNNREYASIELVYYIREGTQLRTSGTKFTLRRDNSGKWKILYWELVDSVDLS